MLLPKCPPLRLRQATRDCSNSLEGLKALIAGNQYLVMITWQSPLFYDLALGGGTR